jgi:hypothetical protein
VTVTLTVPADSAGDMALTEAPLTETAATATEPRFTLVAPPRFVPVTVTGVPPVVGPETRPTPVTVEGPVEEAAVMDTFWTAWMSVRPPVPPVNPTSTSGGNDGHRNLHPGQGNIWDLVP